MADDFDQNCPFCKIVSGGIPAKKVYSDGLCEIVLDVNPVSAGHMLILPKKHYPVLPLLPKETFNHIFNMMPGFVKAMKKAMLSTGANIIIANGAVAGQQSPHMLIHLVPREKSDWLEKYAFSSPRTQDKAAYQILAQHLSQVMQQHLSQMPEPWQKEQPKIPDHLKNEMHRVVYADVKVVCLAAKNPQCPGHLEIHPLERQTEFEKMSEISSRHMFWAASYSASLAFQALKAQGTNIILKDGISDDNPDGAICLHVLPRSEGDGLDLINKPMAKKPDMDKIASKIKDQMFYMQYKEPKEEKIVINLDEQKCDILSIKKPECASGEHEIRMAIKSVRGF